jgi:iron complex outermembrane receptor protein
MFILFLLFSATIAFAQTGTISGKVTDDEGQPLPGALVEIVGTGLKTTADAEGGFTISDVPAGQHTVQASTYSYRTQTATVTVNPGQTPVVKSIRTLVFEAFWVLKPLTSRKTECRCIQRCTCSS